LWNIWVEYPSLYHQNSEKFWIFLFVCLQVWEVKTMISGSLQSLEYIGSLENFPRNVPSRENAHLYDDIPP
jgi:hypothetical protein